MTLNQLNLNWIKLLLFIFFITLKTVSAQVERVSIVNDERGSKLQINGKDFFIVGMNWDYFPIGENYSYSLWTQPDDLIKDALDREMALLKNMGVNVIRRTAEFNLNGLSTSTRIMVSILSLIIRSVVMV